MSKLTNAVVQLEVTSLETDINFPFRNGETCVTRGTAFFFERNSRYLLTCYHCVEKALHIDIFIPKYGKHKFKGKVISQCPLYDLCMIEVMDLPKTFHDFIPLASNGMKITKPGDKVEAIGFPLGQDNIKMTQGIVSGHQNYKYQIDTPVNPGNSGGPIVRDGKVIGIVTSGFLFSNDVGYATPIERYFQIRSKLKKQLTIFPPSSFGFFLQKPPNPSKVKDGLYIYNILKQKSVLNFAKPKLKVGDVLLKVNNYNVKENGLIEKMWMYNYITLDNLLFDMTLGDKIHFEFLRKNTKMKSSLIVSEIKNKFKLIANHQKYCMIGGIVLVPLSSELLEKRIHSTGSNDTNSNDFMEYLQSISILAENYIANQSQIFIVVNILAGSLFQDYFKTYDILGSINDTEFKSILDLKNYVYDSSQRNFSIAMKNGKSASITKSQLLKETDSIQKTYEIEKLYFI